MVICTTCGGENVDGARFCVKCGSEISSAAAPGPGAWRGDESSSSTRTDQAPPPIGGYTPQTPPSSFPTYTPPQSMSYGQPAAGQPMHPAIPALVSLFFPGLGLLFVPNKAGLGIGIFAATLGFAVVATILTFVVVGICLFMLMPIINIAAAVHSWDEAAKTSNGQFQPILFK